MNTYLEKSANGFLIDRDREFFVRIFLMVSYEVWKDIKNTNVVDVKIKFYNVEFAPLLV